MSARKELRQVYHIKEPVQLLRPFGFGLRDKKGKRKILGNIRDNIKNNRGNGGSSSSGSSSSISISELTKEKRKEAIEEFQEMVHQTLENKVGARLFRLVAILFVPLTLLIFLAIYREKVTVNEIFGWALLCMFGAYFFHLFMIFCGCCSSKSDLDENDTQTQSLFRIYSLNSIVPGWTPMAVSYGALMFKHQPIQSISEFSAINGGIAHVMLLIISSYSWVVLLCAFAPEVHEYGLSVLSIGDIFEFCGCFGLVMIGTFELDPWSKTMQTFHNTGAMIGSLTLFGFLYQQYVISVYENDNTPLYLPIGLTAMAIIAYVMWSHFSNEAEKFDAEKYKTSNSKKTDSNGNDEIEIGKKVTYISFGNVISEAIVLLCGATAMCLWLQNFDYCHKYYHCRWPSNVTPSQSDMNAN